ncbi:MAG: hypothetical protein M3R62_15455 [Acidobacteriota bacterium]|nr:hypothetical protein [Acidobacteriota bacterium]
MTTERDSERPRAVMIIGWIWFALAAILAAKSLLDLVVWRVLRPAVPLLVQLGGQAAPSRIFNPLLAHLTEIKLAQALAWASVAVAAFHFLRLRRWARAAIQAISWIGLAYVCCVGVVWAAAYSRIRAAGVVAPSSAPPAHRTLLLLGGLLVCVVLVAGFIATIVLLRSADVRRAFAVPSELTTAASARGAPRVRKG